MDDNKIKTHVGFSLVELMAVVAIIGVLVSLALPRFKVFIARGRQSEAMQNMGQLITLQKAFNLREASFGRDDQWHRGLTMGLGDQRFFYGTCTDSSAGTKNTLGFRVEDCDKLRYTYVTYGVSSVIAINSNVSGKKIYPGCAGNEYDLILLKPSGEISHGDIVQKCE